MPQVPESILAGKKRPFTGAEYLESLRDGREVYIYGERVKDVTRHPAFRNAAVSIAKLYDAMHAEKTKGVLTGPTDTGSGGYTHRFFKAARSREDLLGQRDAIAAWARMTYGWMGRSPDYKAAFLNTLGANADFYGKFAHNARAWHDRSQEAVLYLNHALINPPIDRGNAGTGRLRSCANHPAAARRALSRSNFSYSAPIPARRTVSTLSWNSPRAS